ncbi:hypothetical protein [Cedratvirus kamchatka]|uniref:Uncharacterized protein n=1 Tax=Cedratvirus kamchatka TaxID=2716914 RepID=A0A6G8MY81_9VIRU|nr:hypothetical protein [Cedratvirus kamchatka]
MLSPEHFIADGAKVDYDYYLEHFGIKKTEKLYNIAHGAEIEKREHVHQERCAYMALYDFLCLYPSTKRSVLCKRLTLPPTKPSMMNSRREELAREEKNLSASLPLA